MESIPNPAAYQGESVVTLRTGYRNRVIQGRRQELSHVPDLIFETFHPDDPEHMFFYSQYYAEDVSHASMNYDQAAEVLFSRPLHQHDYFEFLYVIRGQMYQWIENQRHLYPQGSLCLLNRNIRHQEEFSTDFYTAFLALPVSLVRRMLADRETYFFPCESGAADSLCLRFFQENSRSDSTALMEYIDFIPDPDKPAVQQTMHSLFQDLVAQYIAPRVGSTYQIMGLLMQIFHQLSLPDQYSNTALKLAPDPELQLFDSISAMLRLHSGRISRSELAQALNYSGHYLNRVVKRHTGLSLQQYGMQFAMQAAAGMLCYTDRKVEEICEYLRFSNQTQFYRQFQDRHGLTPRQYRQACRQGSRTAPAPGSALP